MLSVDLIQLRIVANMSGDVRAVAEGRQTIEPRMRPDPDFLLKTRYILFE